jgi:hypothetical protein
MLMKSAGDGDRAYPGQACAGQRLGAGPARQYADLELSCPMEAWRALGARRRGDEASWSSEGRPRDGPMPDGASREQPAQQPAKCRPNGPLQAGPAIYPGLGSSAPARWTEYRPGPLHAGLGTPYAGQGNGVPAWKYYKQADIGICRPRLLFTFF